MHGFLISTVILFLVFYILSREIWVKVKNGELLVIEIHLPIFAIILTKRKEKKGKRQQNKRKDLSALTYLKIIIKELKRFEKCEVVINNVIPPHKTNNFSYSTLTKPYGYQSLIYAVIAYLETKVEKLTLAKNAVKFIPGNSLFLCDITIKARLYRIAFGAFCLYRNINKEKGLSFS